MDNLRLCPTHHDSEERHHLQLRGVCRQAQERLQHVDGRARLVKATLTNIYNGTWENTYRTTQGPAEKPSFILKVLLPIFIYQY